MGPNSSISSSWLEWSTMSERKWIVNPATRHLMEELDSGESLTSTKMKKFSILGNYVKSKRTSERVFKECVCHWHIWTGNGKMTSCGLNVNKGWMCTRAWRALGTYVGDGAAVFLVGTNDDDKDKWLKRPGIYIFQICSFILHSCHCILITF